MGLFDKPTKDSPAGHKDAVLPGIVAAVTDDRKNAVYVDLDLELEPDQSAPGNRSVSREDIPPGLAAAVLNRRQSRLRSLLRKLPFTGRQSFFIFSGAAVLILCFGAASWLYLSSRDEAFPPGEPVAQLSIPAAATGPGEGFVRVRETDTQAQTPSGNTSKEQTVPTPAAPNSAKTEPEAAAVAAQAAEKNEPPGAGIVQESQYSQPPARRTKAEKQNIPREPDPPRETPDYYVYSGYACETRGDYPGALAWYKQALVFDRQGYRLLNKIAYVLMRMALYEDAAAYAAQAISARKDYIPALVNMGIIRAQQGALDEAGRCFAEALTLDGTNTDALYNSMLLLKKQGNYTGAAEIEQKLKALGYPSGP